MKTNQIASVLVSMSMGLSSLAMAQSGPGGPGDPGGPGQPGGPDHRGGPPNGPRYQPPEQSQQQRPGNPPNMVGHNGGGIQNPNYARQGDNRPQPPNGRPPMEADGGPHWNGPRDWHRGDRIPDDYRDRQYVVDDYRGYGLSRPQRGYQWVGVNGDFALVAIATGIIAQVVVNGR